MENFALVSLVENLRPAMLDVIIRRVIQHHSNGFIFQTRSTRLSALKFIAEPLSPAFYISEARPPVETPTMDFLMVLRKHLTSAEVTSFSKPLSERIVEFGFKTAVPTKELETMSLIVELLPNAPNLILLDAERRVVSSFVPLTPQHGIGEYEPYAYPTKGTKIDLERFLSDEDAPDLSPYEEEKSREEWIVSHIAGVGPVFAAELVHRQVSNKRPLVEEIRELIEQVKSPSKGAYLYTDLPLGHILEQNDLRRFRKAVLSPVPLKSLERSHSSRLFSTIFEATRYYYDELETRTLLEQAKLPLLREVRDGAKRLADHEKKLVREQKKYEDAESLQKTAQMLNSGGMKMDQRSESVVVTDYFAETPQEHRIALDASLTLRENIDKMFKKYQKAGRGKGMVAQQLGTLRNRRALLDEQLKRLQAIKDWDTWLAISDKIEKQQQGLESAEPGREVQKKRLRSVIVDNREILIGRSSRENDELTFRIANPDDFWFHVAEYSGSHVVVRNPQKDKELPEEVLTKAAQLAAYYSQARNSSKVEVHYTRRKHVAKPRRAKAGLVRLLEFKSIKVEPKNWLGE
jgi:predicted ribosome quality control (RQC) complex YloA/Tae2 family protein